ncbi:HD domain-containing protein [Candidatus Uhrbacteria bacterium]|nr:HD domain-containing protein [Candidatus Uhrbacteria bacterium]
MTTTIESQLRSFAETVWLNKGRAYYVGGTVRDRILGIDAKDVDIEVHGVEAGALKVIVESHFKDVKEMGAAFGVLHTHVEDMDVDISLPRKDSKIGAGHKGFDVNVDPNMSIEDALKRRDFTINAMLEDMLDGTVHDPYGGRQDLNDRILKVVDKQTFGEDPLRVLRGVQLAGRLELKVEATTEALMKSMSSQLHELSIDRKRTEWRKLFLKAHKPSIGLDLAYRIGVFEDDMPLVRDMVETEQEFEWHPEGCVWNHAMWVTDEAVLIAEREDLSDDDRLTLVLGGFCHDCGKPETTKIVDGRIRSPGHPAAGSLRVKSFLGAMGLTKYADAVTPLVKYHMYPYPCWKKRDTDEAFSDGAFRNLARKLKPSNIEMLSWVAEADSRGRGPFPEGFVGKNPDASFWFIERAKDLDIHHGPPADVISGRDMIKMGFKPGPHFGLVIRAANELQDEHGMSRNEIMDRILKKPNVVKAETIELMVGQLK